MYSNLRKKAKNDFEKDCFKLIINRVLVKIMENTRKQRGINLVTTERRRIFGIKIKLSYYKVFHKRSISNRSDKNADTYE